MALGEQLQEAADSFISSASRFDTLTEKMSKVLNGGELEFVKTDSGDIPTAANAIRATKDRLLAAGTGAVDQAAESSREAAASRQDALTASEEARRSADSADDSEGEAKKARDASRRARDKSQESERAAGESETAAAKSEASASESEESANEHRKDAASSAATSRSNRDAALDAANSIGDIRFFSTHSEASAALSGLEDQQIVDILNDEEQSGSHVRYRVESGALALLRALPSPQSGSLWAMIHLPRFEVGNIRLRSFWPGRNEGGGEFYYDPGKLRADADGNFSIDPDALGGWDGSKDAAQLRAFFEAQGTGSDHGCFVRNAKPGFIPLEIAGAIGDGAFNNTPSFLAISDYVASRGGHSFIEASPVGEYVYEQWASADSSRYYGGHDIFRFIGAKSVFFGGHGVTFRLADNTHFGSFNDETGESDQGSDSTSNGGGRFIYVRDWENVTISGVNWDGNNQNHVVGGSVGDTGWQVVEYGLEVRGTGSKLTVQNCTFNNSGLDGYAIGVDIPPGVDPQMHFINVSASHNGRQACSLTGGRRIRFTDCSYLYTGEGQVVSAPGACLDIEPEGGRACTDNVWNNCIFIGGRSCLTTTGGRDNYFYNSKLLSDGGTPWLYNGASNARSVLFFDCQFRGRSTVVRAAQFYRCRFDDDNSEAGFEDVNIGNYMFSNVSNTVDGAKFRECYIRKTQLGGRIWYNVRDVDDCVVEIAYDASKMTADNNGSQAIGQATGRIGIIDNISGDIPDGVEKPTYGKGYYSTRGEPGDYAYFIGNHPNIKSMNAESVTRENAPPDPATAVGPIGATAFRITSRQSGSYYRDYGGVQLSAGGSPTSGGFGYIDGDRIYRNRGHRSGDGSSEGWVCTNSGMSGSTAVFHSFGIVNGEV